MIPMKRCLHFRVVLAKLECGHIESVTTSFYRLSKARAACIYMNLIRKGMWCFRCHARCQPIEYFGTARAERCREGE